MGSDKSDDSDVESQSKQGGVCCGCCCDYRRAVIIIGIWWTIAYIIGLATRDTSLDWYLNDIDDANVVDAITNAFKADENAILAITIISLVLSVGSVVGAFIHNKFLVALNVIWIIVYFIVWEVYINKSYDNAIAAVNFANSFGNTIADGVAEALRTASITSQVFAGIFTVIWAYPSVMLVCELHSGVMSAKNYPRERASCCCV